jgi:MinD-like ATPase involved in chromosome partitioning or flagellar assembly
VGRTCTVCSHPEAFAVNEALVLSRQGNRRVAAQYGLSEQAIRRHREHIPELLVKASANTEEFEADAILMRIERLERETLEQLEALKEDDDPDRRTILLAIREQRSNIELVAKVRQLIDQAPKVAVALVEHPDYQKLEEVLVRALEPYPAARYAVADAMKELESA